MEKINIIIDTFKNININTVINYLISLLIFLLFRIFSGVVAYCILRVFSLKDNKKLDKNYRKTAIYKFLTVSFSLTGAYIALRFLDLPEKLDLIIFKSFKIFLIVVLAQGIAGIASARLNKLKSNQNRNGKYKDETFILFAAKFVKFIVYVIAIFIIITELGYNISGLLTGLGLSGVVVALAAQDAAKNIFGGIVILWDKPFKIGDWIETNNFEGFVEEITFRSTRIRSFEDSIVTIPNSTISNESLINWSRMKKRRYKQNFELELTTSLKKICDIQNKITLMLEQHPRVLKDGILVKFDKVTENGYNILIRVFTNALSYEDYLSVTENINFKIISIIHKEKAELAYPSQSIYVKN